MKQLTLLSVILSCFSANAQHPLEWAKQMSLLSSPASVQSMDLATDGAGNVYTTGQFHGSVDFDPGPGNMPMSTPTGSGGGNIFISKISATGDFIWAKQFSGSIYMYANAIAVSAAGDVFVGGNFSNTVDFDPGPGTAYLTSTGPTDIFVCRLTANGDFVWVKHMHSNNYESVEDMSFAQDGDLLLTGGGSPSTDFDPGPGVQNLPVGDFIIKLSLLGDLVWATDVPGNGKAIDVAADGTILQLGGDMSFIRLNKLDASGNILWTRSFDGGYMDAGDVTHNDSGEIYVSGNFEEIVWWGTGSAETLSTAGFRDAFIVRFDQTGTTLDAWLFGGDGYQSLNCLQYHNGTLTAAGAFFGSTDFDPGPDSAVATTISSGWHDIAVVTLNESGTIQCLSIMGNVQTDYPSSLFITADNELLITGQLGDTTDLDPGPGTTLLNEPSNFIAKYSLCETNTGFGDIDKLEEAFCYPNPTTGIVTIAARGIVEVHVHTIEGKIVQRKRLTGTQSVDLTELADGLYTVSLIGRNKVIRQKLIVSH